MESLKMHAIIRRWSKAIFLLSFVVHLSCTRSFPDYKDDNIILELSTLTENTMEGSFTDLEKGLGIQFVSKSDSLSITTLDGELLLIAEDSQGIALRLVNIGGKYFIQQMRDHDDPSGTTSRDYAVPVSKYHLIKNATPELLNALLRKLKNVDENAQKMAVQVAIQELLMQPEILLIERAAFALGDEGITGLNYPSSLPFYLAALQLQKTLMNSTRTGKHVQYEGQNDEFRIPSNRLKRESCLSQCPPCPNDECLGLCGYGCNCWTFVCGDCCYHLGCYEHDLCCRYQFIQTKCLFPFGFRCESAYSC